MVRFGKSSRTRLAVGGLAFAVFAPLAYLTQRLVDRARFGAPDPLGMLRTVEVVFYWRSATACWWGGLATLIAVWMIRDRDDAQDAPSVSPSSSARAASWLAAGAVLVATSLAVLGWLFP